MSELENAESPARLIRKSDNSRPVDRGDQLTYSPLLPRKWDERRLRSAVCGSAGPRERGEFFEKLRLCRVPNLYFITNFL